jgi:hypothetical protein
MSENGVQNIKTLLCHPTPRFCQLHKGVARFSTVLGRLVTSLIEKTGRRGLPKISLLMNSILCDQRHRNASNSHGYVEGENYRERRRTTYFLITVYCTFIPAPDFLRQTSSRHPERPNDLLHRHLS